MMKGPLKGYRVLDFTQFESGTACTEMLAWMGAEVIKVERPGIGEQGRFSVEKPDVDTYGFLILNMNKKSITCNAKHPEGLSLLKRLIARCDVVVENMGPGSMDRLGLSYEDCKAINQGIIYASIKGFAKDSPYHDYPAFDPIATHMGVLVSATGLEDQPIKAGISVADSGSGMAMAMCIIAALLQREREGVGQRIDLAMQDFMIGLSRASWEPYYNSGKSPRRVGNGMPLEDVAPSDTYRCKPFGKNDYVHIYCSRSPVSKQWEHLCHAIGRDDLLKDPDLATPHSRFLHKEKCDQAIQEYCNQHTKFEVMEVLAGKADVPAGALLDVDDITRDQNYTDRGLLVDITHPQLGTVRVPGFAPRMSELEIEYQCSPTLGGANEEVYGDLLGLDEKQIAQLKEDKAI